MNIDALNTLDAEDLRLASANTKRLALRLCLRTITSWIEVAAAQGYDEFFLDQEDVVRHITESEDDEKLFVSDDAFNTVFPRVIEVLRLHGFTIEEGVENEDDESYDFRISWAKEEHGVSNPTEE